MKPFKVILTSAAIAVILPTLAHSQQAKQAFDARYGKRLQQVQQTPDPKDDIALAKELLEGSKGLEDSPEMQVVLLEKALNLAVAHAGGIDVGVEAGEALVTLRPKRAGAVDDLLLPASERQYRLAKGADERAAAAEEWLGLLLKAAERKHESGASDDAISLYRKALPFLKQDKVRRDGVLHKIERAAEQRKAETEMTRLRKALAAKPKDAKSARSLAMLLVTQKADFKSAAEVAGGAGDLQLSEMLRLAQRDVDTVSAEDAIRLASWCEEQSAKASTKVKGALLAKAVNCYQRAVNVGDEQSAATMQAKLALAKLEGGAADETGADDKVGTSPPKGVLSGAQADEVVTLKGPGRYQLKGSYSVPTGKVLTIQSGVTIVCDAGSEMVIDGSMEMAGSAQARVIFEGSKHGPGFWKGITLRKSVGAALKHVWVTDAVVGVSVRQCKPTLESCVLAGNRTGLHAGDYGTGSHVKLEGCVISFNEEDGVAISGSEVNLTNCTITKNGKWGIRGEYYAAPSMEGCVVALNREGGVWCRYYACKARGEAIGHLR